MKNLTLGLPKTRERSWFVSLDKPLLLLQTNFDYKYRRRLLWNE
jgi:hypothetical protein